MHVNEGMHEFVHVHFNTSPIPNLTHLCGGLPGTAHPMKSGKPTMSISSALVALCVGMCVK